MPKKSIKYHVLGIKGFWIVLCFLLVSIILTTLYILPVQAQNLYQCEWQADGSGCWKIENYSDYEVDGCNDYYDEEACWVQCGDYECGGGSPSDEDGDGLPNISDPDIDGDGVLNPQDGSDYEKEDPDGCQDWDGVPEPPSACGGGYTYPTPGYTPPSTNPDPDGDGFTSNDQCPYQYGTYNGCTAGNIPPPNPGCLDSDWDGTCNDQDPCPNQVGSPANRGCAYVPPQNPQPAPPSAPQGPEPPIPEEPPAIPPSAYLSTWEDSGQVGKLLHFQAQAYGQDLAQVDILIADSTSPLNSSSSWEVLGSRSCSGTTCLIDVNWVPDSGDIGKNYEVVVNAYDSNGLQCSGNRVSDHPEFWNDCADGEADIRNIAIAELVQPAPAPAPSPSSSQAPITLPNGPPPEEPPTESPTAPDNPAPEVPAQGGCLPLLQYFCPLTNQCAWNFESCSQGEQPEVPETPSQPTTPEVPSQATPGVAPICNLGESYGSCQEDSGNGLAYGNSYCIQDSYDQIRIECILDSCSNGGNPPLCEEPREEVQPEVPTSTPEVPAESTSGVTQTVETQNQPASAEATAGNAAPTIQALHTFING